MSRSLCACEKLVTAGTCLKFKSKWFNASAGKGYWNVESINNLNQSIWQTQIRHTWEIEVLLNNSHIYALQDGTSRKFYEAFFRALPLNKYVNYWAALPQKEASPPTLWREELKSNTSAVHSHKPRLQVLFEPKRILQLSVCVVKLFLCSYSCCDDLKSRWRTRMCSSDECWDAFAYLIFIKIRILYWSPRGGNCFCLVQIRKRNIAWMETRYKDMNKIVK